MIHLCMQVTDLTVHDVLNRSIFYFYRLFQYTQSIFGWALFNRLVGELQSRDLEFNGDWADLEQWQKYQAKPDR
jgi:hypothetical protein